MECGECTLCCKLLPIPWMDSPHGEYCKECNPDQGCKIYNTTISEKCKDFNCVYTQIENTTEKLRPDNCGIVFEKPTKDIFFGTINDEIGILNETANKFIELCISRGFSVILRHPEIKEKVIFNSEGKTINQVWGEFKKAWQHQTTIQT